MRTVHKYHIPTTDAFALQLPRGAKVLHVDIQRGKPQLWALVDPDAPLEKRFFWLAGTGHKIDDETELEHCGTFQLAGGELVFHVFEAKRPS